RRGREEAAAGKYAAANVRQPRLTDREESREATRHFQRGREDLVDVALRRGFHRRELQVFLRAEVCEEAALRHLQLIREAADGEAFESFERRHVHGAIEN